MYQITFHISLCWLGNKLQHQFQAEELDDVNCEMMIVQTVGEFLTLFTLWQVLL